MVEDHRSARPLRSDLDSIVSSMVVGRQVGHTDRYCRHFQQFSVFALHGSDYFDTRFDRTYYPLLKMIISAINKNLIIDARLSIFWFLLFGVEWSHRTSSCWVVNWFCLGSTNNAFILDISSLTWKAFDFGSLSYHALWCDEFRTTPAWLF